MGHAVACAAGLAALKIVEDENLPNNAKEVGGYFLEQLMPLMNEYDIIGDIRGKGLMIAIEMVADRATKVPLAPDAPFVGALSARAMKHGLIVRGIANKLIISPPLIFTKENVDEVVSIMNKVFAECCK